MIKIVNATERERRAFIEELKLRVGRTDPETEQKVARIIEDVRTGGDEAVKAYSEKFDGWTPDRLELSREEMEELSARCSGEFLEALKRAAANIYDFHSRQKQQSRIDPQPNGVIMGQRVRGLHRAGVGEIVMATPPGRAGHPDPNIIAAALVAGVDRVFLMGGAQAVAALAYGTESIPKVDKIVGPGNIFVATAKKQLYGVVDIDMIAGPSEILILADSSAEPEYLAADLMSQAEHDPMASAILITDDRKLAESTVSALYRQLETLSRRDIIERALDGYGAVIVCENIKEAVEFANQLAPEHLEVCCRDPFEYLGRLDNAGSVFLGNYAPEPLGDYFAGANHVLPTGGTARFFSPLSVDDFIKKSSFIYYTKDALMGAAGDIIELAETEELTAHANSIRVRLEE